MANIWSQPPPVSSVAPTGHHEGDAHPVAEWLVVLGEAGSGKTTLLASRALARSRSEDVLWADLSLVRDLAAITEFPNTLPGELDGRPLHLFFDAADEGIHPPDDVVRAVLAAVATAIVGRAPRDVRLTIACRSWWWGEVFSMLLRRSAESHGLTDGEVAEVTLTERTNLPALLKDISGRPIDDSTSPIEAFAVASRGRFWGTPAEGRLDEPLRACMDLATLMVLGGKRLVGSPEHPAVLDPESDAARGLGLPPFLRPLTEAGVLVADGQHLRFCHWAVAEFLAALRLTELASTTVRALLAPDPEFPVEGCPVAVPLLPVVAWLTSLNADARAWMSAEDPEDLLVADRFALTESTRRSLVVGLLAQAAPHHFGDLRVAGIKHSSIAEQLRPSLADHEGGAQRFAKALLSLRIAEANRVDELAPTIDAMVRSPRVDDYGITLRVVAVQALAVLADFSASALRDMLPPTATHGRVLSEILVHVAQALSPPELLGVIRATGFGDWHGDDIEFYRFGLPELLDREAVDSVEFVAGLCDALRELVADEDSVSEPPEKLTAAALRAGWRLGDGVQVRDAALQLAWAFGGKHHHQLPVIWERGEAGHAGWSPGDRRTFWWEGLIGLALSTQDRHGDSDRVGGALRAWDTLPGLLASDALTALLDLLSAELDEARAEVLDVWVWNAFRLDTDTHCSAVAEALSGEESAGRRRIQKRFSAFGGGPGAWATLRAASVRTKTVPQGPPTLELVSTELDRAASPGARWWRTIHLLSADPETRRIGDPWRGSLPELRGVPALMAEPDLLRRTTDLVVRFLEDEDPKTADWWAEDSFPGILLAGVRAAHWVVWQRATSRVSEAAWAKWTPALLVVGDLAATGALSDEVRRTVISIAPKACLLLMQRVRSATDETRRRIEVSRAAGLGLPDLDSQLVSLLGEGVLDPRSDSELLDALLRRGVPQAVDLATARLASAGVATTEQRVSAARSLLSGRGLNAVDLVVRALRSDDALFNALLPELVGPFGVPAAWMQAASALDLEWLCRQAHVQVAAVPEPEGAEVAQWVGRGAWPTSNAPWVFAGCLRDRASRADLEALQRIVGDLGQGTPGLHRMLTEARTRYARRAWRPVSLFELSRILLVRPMERHGR